MADRAGQSQVQSFGQWGVLAHDPRGKSLSEKKRFPPFQEIDMRPRCFV
jgi:hypothetical protein